MSESKPAVSGEELIKMVSDKFPFRLSFYEESLENKLVVDRAWLVSFLDELREENKSVVVNSQRFVHKDQFEILARRLFTIINAVQMKLLGEEKK